MRGYLVLAALMFLVAAWLFISESDAEHEARDDARYCKMVREGAWPDYRKEYDNLCK